MVTSGETTRRLKATMVLYACFCDAPAAVWQCAKNWEDVLGFHYSELSCAVSQKIILYSTSKNNYHSSNILFWGLSTDEEK